MARRRVRSIRYYAIPTIPLRGGKKKSLALTKRIPDFFETKAAKVFHVGGGKVGDIVVPESDAELISSGIKPADCTRRVL